MKVEWPRQIPIYTIPDHERAYWDELDSRVTCNGCRNRSDIWCRAKQSKTIYPPMLKHHCEDRK